MPDKLTKAEECLCDLMHDIAPEYEDFRIAVGLFCRHNNYTEELVEYIKTNHITDCHDIEDWMTVKLTLPE